MSEQQSPSLATRLAAEEYAAGLPTGPFVAGDWRMDDNSLNTFTVLDPVTEKPLAEVAEADDQVVEAAVTAARGALDGGEWSTLDGASRGILLNRLADLIEEHTEQIADLETLEVGKARIEPRVIDVPQSVATLRHFAGWADKIGGHSIPTPGYMGRQTMNYTVREPIGVVAAITPWNSPTMIGTWKLAPALAAGCAVVLKPPEDAPLSSLLLASLVQQAGFPAGALSVLPGRGSVTGQLLVDHPGVDKISFTGSPASGRLVAASAARTFRPTTFELGGKSPQIVFPDADLDAAAQGVALGIFANQGETCAAGSRILVHRDIHDEFVERLGALAGGVVVGDPFDEGTTMGALINARQRDRVLGYVEVGRAEGARIVAGGETLTGPGFFVTPTIFADANNSMRIAREEIFGPVGAVMSFADDDEALAIANDSDYALAATLWTRDVSRAHSLALRVRAGAVAVNGWSPLDPRLPWGGPKLSGHGRELGWAGIEANTVEKTITLVL